MIKPCAFTLERDGSRAGVLHVLPGVNGKQPIVGHFEAKGFDLIIPFHGDITWPDHQGPGRPKKSINVKRAMAAQLAKQLCLLGGHNITRYLPELAGYSTYEKARAAVKRAPFQIDPKQTTLGRHVTELPQYPYGAVAFIPCALIAADYLGTAVTGTGYLWSPGTKEAVIQGFILESERDIARGKDLLLAIVQANKPRGR
ncbi:hypothetical protein [uncultured Thiocystis sp.]|jgi:hypothetical protein|uniref:hypothetical protein n=1 Tax=uncultured Thiocystis sp. TaxID=1202134 RepID=UPI0025FF4CB0|nr:hypothetical protein [uncultured Thiocystis sp.]